MAHPCYLAAPVESLIGVTRVARVTGLDRSGVEVACAVRPGGHVLQVANGKGLRWEDARASALSEAAELWAAEKVEPSELVFGSAGELREAWPPEDLVAPRLWSMSTRIAWRRAEELFTGREVLVPAQAVHCPPPGSVSLGPALVRWSTNGMGAHPKRPQAVLHALLEACERDQLERALPRGWTEREIRRRKVAVRSPLWTQLRDAGLEAHVFDLSGALPLAGAILVDLEEGPLPVTAGYACALRFDDAVQGALLESAQSRLTDVHGAREDVAAQDRGAMRGLRRACQRARPRAAPRQPARGGVLQRMRAAGFTRAAVVELARAPLHVVKVVVPGMRVSELL
jgi:ribosomal protein S12 methylthiotransferase accessory factor